MSTKSGIKASDDLLESLKDFKTGAILIKISDDDQWLVKDEGFPGVNSSDVDSILNSVQQYIEKNYPEPSFIIFGITNNDSTEEGFIAFIPDDAPIRRKMLYASSKNTLLTQVGLNRFKKSNIFNWTLLEELSPQNYRNSGKDDTQASLLTEDEKVLRSINNFQDMSLAETGVQGSSTVGTPKNKLVSMHNTSGSKSGLLFEVNSDLEAKIGELEPSTLALLLFNINIEAEKFMLLLAHSGIKVSELIETISSNVPQSSPFFAVYNYSSNKYAFIYSCPSGSKVKARMIYASNKQELISFLKKKLDDKNVVIDKFFEVGDIDELDLHGLEEKSSLQKNTGSTSGLKFSKPRGPRRK